MTIGIDKDIEIEWIRWIKETHIPHVLSSGYFTGHKFYKVLTHDDEASASYCIQYFTPDIVQFNQYLENFAPKHMEEHRKRFPDRHAVFNTLLEEVD
jgi:Domain of unknown function (DUF4286)